MTRRLCIVPRWGASQDMEWYPWLRAQPAVTERFGEVLAPDIPGRDVPTIQAWTASLRQTSGVRDLASTYFVGHSVGCQGILHYLASLPDRVTVAGFLAVAGWWTVDRPWPTIEPWLYTDAAPTFDVARARAACPHVVVLISDNDPFTADWRVTERQWQDRMAASVKVIAGGAHFNSDRSPAVLEALAGLVGQTG